MLEIKKLNKYAISLKLADENSSIFCIIVLTILFVNSINKYYVRTDNNIMIIRRYKKYYK